MKKVFLCLVILFSLSTMPALAVTAKTVTKPGWKPAIPTGFTVIDWAKAPGIASFFKSPENNGTIDYITRIYLPQNQINFIIAPKPVVPPTSTDSQIEPSTALPVETPLGPGPTSADINTFPNLTFDRVGAEAAKAITPTTKFIWDAPFFNMAPSASELSMALKYSTGATTTISRGSRSVPDMALPRRMLIINNETAKATIQDFDSTIFTDTKSGDQAIEGFDPSVAKSDSAGGGAARLFLGVSNDGQELIVYCSQLATIGEATEALAAAGVTPDHLLQADGGGSAACGYNLPGQFFVEPTRTLPLLMGAETILKRGVVTNKTINVRTGPATKNPIATTLSKDVTVRVYEEKNGWYRIGDKQWVLKTLIK